jgi:hypothetical protein
MSYSNTYTGDLMKKSMVVLSSLLLAAGVFVGGCKNANGPDEDIAPGGVTNEEQAMKYYATVDEFVANDEVTFADAAVQPFDYGSFGKIDASVTPIRWGRFISSVTRTVTTTVQPGDTVAVSVVEKTITGTLKIRAITTSGDTITIDKPFTDKSTRNVIFKRIDRNVKKFWKNWVPVASSLVKGGTAEPNNSVNITKMVLYLPGDTITVDDPLNYFLRYKWQKIFKGGRKDLPELTGGQSVKLEVTVVSASADTDLVALRFGFDKTHQRRVRLVLASEVNNGDGTYTRVFEVSRTAPVFMHFHVGAFHLGVEAATRATLYDDAAPYSVSWWGIPYRVR